MDVALFDILPEEMLILLFQAPVLTPINRYLLATLTCQKFKSTFTLRSIRDGAPLASTDQANSERLRIVRGKWLLVNLVRSRHDYDFLLRLKAELEVPYRVLFPFPVEKCYFDSLEAGNISVAENLFPMANDIANLYKVHKRMFIAAGRSGSMEMVNLVRSQYELVKKPPNLLSTTINAGPRERKMKTLVGAVEGGHLELFLELDPNLEERSSVMDSIIAFDRIDFFAAFIKRELGGEISAGNISTLLNEAMNCGAMKILFFISDALKMHFHQMVKTLCGEGEMRQGIFATTIENFQFWRRERESAAVENIDYDYIPLIPNLHFSLLSSIFSALNGELFKVNLANVRDKLTTYEITDLLSRSPGFRYGYMKKKPRAGLFITDEADDDIVLEEVLSIYRAFFDLGLIKGDTIVHLPFAIFVILFPDYMFMIEWKTLPQLLARINVDPVIVSRYPKQWKAFLGCLDFELQVILLLSLLSNKFEEGDSSSFLSHFESMWTPEHLEETLDIFRARAKPNSFHLKFLDEGVTDPYFKQMETNNDLVGICLFLSAGRKLPEDLDIWSLVDKTDWQSISTADFDADPVNILVQRLPTSRLQDAPPGVITIVFRRWAEGGCSEKFLTLLLEKLSEVQIGHLGLTIVELFNEGRILALMKLMAHGFELPEIPRIRLFIRCSELSHGGEWKAVRAHLNEWFLLHEVEECSSDLMGELLVAHLRSLLVEKPRLRSTRSETVPLPEPLVSAWFKKASTKDAIIVIERLLDDSQVHFGLPTLRTILTDEQVAAVTEKMLLWFEKGDVGNILDLEKCGFGVPPLNWTSLFAAAIKEDRSVDMARLSKIPLNNAKEIAECSDQDIIVLFYKALINFPRRIKDFFPILSDHQKDLIYVKTADILRYPNDLSIIKVLFDEDLIDFEKVDLVALHGKLEASPLRTRVMALIFEHPNQISRANNLDLVTLLMVLLTKTNFTCLIALKDLLSEKQLKSLSSLPFQWKVKGDHLFVVLFNEAGFPIAEGCNIAVSYEVVRRAHERVRLLSSDNIDLTPRLHQPAERTPVPGMSLLRSGGDGESETLMYGASDEEVEFYYSSESDSLNDSGGDD